MTLSWDKNVHIILNIITLNVITECLVYKQTVTHRAYH